MSSRRLVLFVLAGVLFLGFTVPASTPEPGLAAEFPPHVPASVEFVIFPSTAVANEIDPFYAVLDVTHICPIPPADRPWELPFWDHVTTSAFLSDGGGLSGGCAGGFSALPDVDFSTSANLSGQINTQTGVTSLSYVGALTTYSYGVLEQWSYTVTDSDGEMLNPLQGYGYATFEIAYSCSEPEDIPQPTCREDVNYSGTFEYQLFLTPVTCGASTGARDGSACDPIDVSIDHLEVIQVVTDETNSIPLVAKKPLVVRAILRADVTIPSVFGSLSIAADLGGFPGPFALVESTQFSGHIDGGATAAPSPDRHDSTKSLDFKLLTIETGDYWFRVELDLPPGVADPDTSNNSMQTAVTIEPARVMTVRHVAICLYAQVVAPLGPCLAGSAANGRLEEVSYPLPIASEKESVTPYGVSPLKFSYIGTVATREGLRDFERRLRQFALEQKTSGAVPKESQMVGWMYAGAILPAGRLPAGASNYQWGGRGDIAWLRQAEQATSVTLLQKMLAHNFGIGMAKDNQNVACSHGVQPSTSGWPYETSGINGWAMMTLTKFASYGDSIIGPDGARDLSAPITGCPGERWVSPHTYRVLLDALPREGDAQGGSLRSDELPPLPAVIVTGSARADGTQARIEQVRKITIDLELMAINKPDGNHCLRFTQGGLEVGRFCFDLAFEDTVSGESLSEDFFAFAIARTHEMENLDGVTLVRAGGPSLANSAGSRAVEDEIASLALSANSPSAAISEPAAGAVWTGQEVIEWAASDLDGDLLTHSVYFRRNASDPWSMLAAGVTGTLLPTDASTFPGTTEAQIRVVTTDGLRFAEDISAPFTIPFGAGDANCSGDVDAVDSLAVLGMLAGLSTPDCADVVDVTCDSSATIADVLALRRYSAGLPVTTPANCPPIGGR